MISFGIRFGEGFDRSGVLKMMQSIPVGCDYDILVIGSSLGGIACAKEASLAGKKAAIVRYRKYTPAEEEGYDEDLGEMESILMDDGSQANGFSGSASRAMKMTKSTGNNSILSSKSNALPKSSSKKSLGKTLRYRKIRLSRLDLMNELYKRGRDGRKLMLKGAPLQSSLRHAQNFGWRIPSILPTISLNWKKMSDFVMDCIMEENWSLVKTLADDGVEIIDGKPSFIDKNTVKIEQNEVAEFEVTAEVICIAVSSDFIIPREIPGAIEYGITCDDFIRLSESPGKTLVVGGTVEGLECAGIIISFKIPVFVVSRSEILKGYDSEISKMIIEDLKLRGVVFLEETVLTSIVLNWEGKLVVEFKSEKNGLSETTSPNKEENSSVTRDEFDTVVFAVGTDTPLEYLKLNNAGVVVDSETKKIIADGHDLTHVPNIYAVGESVAHRPSGMEISETAGKLLGKRLFSGGTEYMNYSMIPSVVITPVEYACVGLSENTALFRFGMECIDIYEGSYTPLEYSTQPKIQCQFKAIVFARDGKVIGLHMYGPDASEVIQGFAAALRMGITITQLQTIVSIPTSKAQHFTRIRKRQTTNGEIQ